MPIQKPVQTTIHATDFRDRVYTFAVESVLAPEATPGVVVVSASAGYWLSIPLTDRPKREQTIPYKKQPDGSWLASSTVTVSYYGDSLPDGIVTVQGSPTELVMLTLAATPTSLQSPEGPVLTVSQDALTFAPTSPGKPGFQLITVKQHYTDGPVTITTDAPDYFQLATDSRPNFASSLIFTPAPTGTYVHVRYLASHRGFHTGQLTIQSSYDAKTVALTGRSAGLLPAVRLTRPASSRMPQRRPGSGVASLKRGAGVLALLLMGGLTYFGYTNRCQLFPALCENTAISQPLTPAPVASPELTNTPTDYSLKKTARRETTKQNKATTIEPATQPRSVSGLADRPAPGPVTDGINQRQPVAASRNPIREPASPKRISNQVVDGVINSRRATPTPPAEESELERELNQPTRNQL